MKVSLFALVAWLAFGVAPVLAEGTITIQQVDGSTNTYDHVAIKIIHSALYLTTADGRGTLVINRAACSYQGQLMVCSPTSATLVQAGGTSALTLKRGTLYVNNTGDPQQLTFTTQKVMPHSIMLSFMTKKGTYVGLNGQIDKVVK